MPYLRRFVVLLVVLTTATALAFSVAAVPRAPGASSGVATDASRCC